MPAEARATQPKRCRAAPAMPQTQLQLTLIEGPRAGFSLKLTLPEAWRDLPAAKLVKAFAKRAGGDGFELLNARGDGIDPRDTIGSAVGDARHLRVSAVPKTCVVLVRRCYALLEDDACSPTPQQ